MDKIEKSCDNCESVFSVEFDDYSEEVLYCPVCGERLPETVDFTEENEDDGEEQ